jgi:hypothetical protein
MKKLTLKIDELTVSSFQTVRAPQASGTVHGAAATRNCTEVWTCGIWCPPTTDPAHTGPCAC